MADKAIGSLNNAPNSVNDSNTLFVVEQGGAAYKLTGSAFFSAMAEIYNAHGYIKSIEIITVSDYSTVETYETGDYCREDGSVWVCLGATSGTWDSTKWDELFDASVLANIYCITLADNSKVLFPVENGRSITGISWSTSGTAGDGQTHTGTISYNDGTTSTVVFKDGVKGDTGAQTYVWIKYASACSGTPPMPASDSDMGDVADDWMGIYTGTASTAPTSRSSYTWYKIKGETGDNATIVSRIRYYQQTTNQTQPNQDDVNWSTTMPVLQAGKYLWTQIVTTWNTGNVYYDYFCSRNGIDGAGSVSSVNNEQPDTNGNVSLTADDIPTDDNTYSVQDHLNAIEATAEDKVLYFDSGASATGWTITATTGNFAVKSDAKITADHVVDKIEFSDITKILSDVVCTTADGSLTLNGTLTSTTNFSIQVTLIKKDN